MFQPVCFAYPGGCPAGSLLGASLTERNGPATLHDALLIDGVWSSLSQHLPKLPQ